MIIIKIIKMIKIIKIIIKIMIIIIIMKIKLDWSSYLSERRLSEVRLQNRFSGLLIWKRDVDQLIETARTQNSGIDDI